VVNEPGRARISFLVFVADRFHGVVQETSVSINA
jgi:hypothetical protein